MEDFANRELMGWPGVSLALRATRHKFTVVARNSNTAQEAVLYDGRDFGKAADSYKHPWVMNPDDISVLVFDPEGAVE